MQATIIHRSIFLIAFMTVVHYGAASVLDQACGLANDQATCTFTTNNVPLMFRPVTAGYNDGSEAVCSSSGQSCSVGATIAGCVVNPNTRQCQFNEDIKCTSSAINEVIKTVVSEVAKCALTLNWDDPNLCPSACGHEITRAYVGHLLLLGEQHFDSIVTAEANIGLITGPRLGAAIQQVLVCTVDTVPPKQLASLQNLINTMQSHDAKQRFNILRSCLAVTDADINTAFVELLALRNAFEQAFTAANKNDAASPVVLPPSTSTASSLSLSTLVAVLSLGLAPLVAYFM
jgi:hypothetical protein